MKNRFKAIIEVHGILINTQHEILLLRRYNTGYNDGNYHVPAGHLEENESIMDGVIREVEEEVGVKVHSDHFKLCNVTYRMNKDNRVAIFFVTTDWIGNPTIKEPNKCDDLIWARIENLPNNFMPYVRNALLDWQQKILYSEEK